MKRFLPYFPYLRPVRLALAIGILCGVIYGAAGGLGIPLMIKYVFPRVLIPDEPRPADPRARPHWYDADAFFERLLPRPARAVPPSASAAPVSSLATPAVVPRLTAWQVWAIALWLPAMFIVRGIAGYLNSYLVQYSGVRILEAIRLDYFRKLQRLPLAFFHRLSTGELIARGLSDTNQLQNTLTVIANDLVKQPATLVSSILTVAGLAYHEQGVLLVLACLFVVPIAVFPIRYVGKKMVTRAIHLQAQTGSLTERFSENLAAVKEVRAFALEQAEVGRFARLTQQLVRAQMKVVKYAQALSPSIEILSAFGIAITFVYAYRNHVHSGVFLSILAALYMSYEPLKKLGAVSNEMKRGEASLRRLEEVLNEPETIADPVTPHPVGRLRGDLSFENVSFAYKAETPVLKGIDERIPAGTVCALVGPSGAGKTTFANLVPRFYDVTSGRLAIDGLDVRAMRFADLRRNIAVVSQDPVLFNDSLYQNLLIGRPDATRAEVIAAARSAHAHDFITAFPKGYDSPAGERGSQLSGGQKQRMAIARAFLRNAPILILDEATSALDSESEAAVQAALKELMVGKTVLIIAHRFSTIRDASLILVFHEGRIVARGPHASLYATNGLYRALYDRQHAAPDQRPAADLSLRPLSL